MRTVHSIPGGIHPPEEKALSNPGTVLDAGIPDQLILPVSQHIGAPGAVEVAVGDRVLGGQPLTSPQGPISAPIHAPTSGIVVAVEQRQIAHASGLEDLCIVLEPDHEDAWVAFTPIEDYRALPVTELVARVRGAGVAGMGGAGFPTAAKLVARDGQSIHTLIINGTECEPYITADDTLMQDDPLGILEGAEILAHIVGAETILFGVEDNKPDALAALVQAVESTDSAVEREVLSFPTKYPSGGEKQLIEILTGDQVPRGGLPADIGIVCQNPGTAVAVRDAVVHGKPLTDRIVTLTGRSLAAPGNYRARLGTPVGHLLARAGHTPWAGQRIVHGGPMMGFALPGTDVGITKITNCVLAPAEAELPTRQPEQACIRCGHCAEACPASLLPQQLYWYAKARDHEQLDRFNLFDCIECGACSWVCPSHIPLVQYYRSAKAAVRQASEEKVRSDRSRARFEAHQLRAEKAAAEKEAKRAARKAAAAQKQAAGAEDPVQAAIARAKARKADTEESN